MLLKSVWILIVFWGKYQQENAKNGISKHLDLEIFWGSMLPGPTKSLCLWHLAVASVIRKVWLYSPVYIINI